MHAEIENALTLAQLFVKMLREQDVQALPAWLTFAQASSVPELRQFAKSALNEIVWQWKRPSPDQKAMDPSKDSLQSSNSSSAPCTVEAASPCFVCGSCRLLSHHDMCG
jgi:hypothetical protein